MVLIVDCPTVLFGLGPMGVNVVYAFVCCRCHKE